MGLLGQRLGKQMEGRGQQRWGVEMEESHMIRPIHKQYNYFQVYY